ncbi:hypothetical protein CLV24_102151 [Pontibacter ummariensis]|uniref:SpoIIAA-like n=1 Tax=Pontibacter ummariensis TaxID=1610492 RepID=A0A239C1P2_9BACT|nr:hypothetical protein [Pontibacter ummariensis]PRY15530.1 hypothetical protein CLV24_102151 [Pontibacter ummariensis]SNS13314.1 hypothetical protein SAMN06296052_102261 [Pontibacter ummariensis]
MLIYNGIITLDYDPTTDILATSMPDVREFAFPEVSFCLGLIVDNVRVYDIKKLLLDSSKSVIEVEDEAYKAITTKFAMDLMGTRLQKLARVGTVDLKREEKSTKLSAELRQELNLPMEFKNFTSRAEAMDWLLSLERV